MKPADSPSDTLLVNLASSLLLNRQARGHMGHGRVELLENIAQTGSIKQAAEMTGMSYKAAWDAIDSLNNLAQAPLVLRSAGGAKGGGTQLTDQGYRLITLFRRLRTEYEALVQQLQTPVAEDAPLYQLLGALTMKTSARNQYQGRVVALRRGAVNAEVSLDLGHDLRLLASITNEAVDELGLQVGGDAIALIKASFVILSPEPDLRLSAGNCLQGEICEIHEGAVNSEVKLALPGQRTLTAIISRQNLEDQSYRIGRPATAYINASQIILAVTAASTNF